MQSNIIRAPHGPDGTKGFRNVSYNLIPAKFNEFDYVLPIAYIPKEYLFHGTCIGKINDRFIHYNVYLTKDKILCFYRNKNELYNYYNLNYNTHVNKKKINNNYYLIIAHEDYGSRMFKFRKKTIDILWKCLKCL